MTRSGFLRTFLGIGASLTLLSSASTGAGAGKWDYLGEANVDGGADHDRIRVGAGQGAFRRIQLLVQNGAIEFDRVEVHFSNGQSYPVQIAARIPAGAHTREIDLPGEKRSIESVEFWYRKGGWGNGAKPKVRLMGIRW
jgi:hypothetical protein